jgi:hypothetical protein
MVKMGHYIEKELFYQQRTPRTSSTIDKKPIGYY